MPRIKPLDRAELSEYEDTFAEIETALGVLPNSTLTMARNPELMKAFAALNAVVMADRRIDGHLKQMVAAVVSNAAGCAYCHAHTSHVAVKRGVEAAKLEALWEYNTSPLFSEAERVALRVAQAAGGTPNAVTDQDMEELRVHYDDEQIVEIVGVISNFGFLNRWNDTMATELEKSPLEWARRNLGAAGWREGKHAASTVTEDHLELAVTDDPPRTQGNQDRRNDSPLQPIDGSGGSIPVDHSSQHP